VRSLVQLVAPLALLIACGGNERIDGASGAGGAEGCGDLERRAEDGTCQAVGVPPGACAEGFEAASDGGCRPRMAASCPDGARRVLGADECVPFDACGNGPWGDIVRASDTVHVDASYVGGGSDGSEAAPFRQIGPAIDAAAAGATVAVAAGIYLDFEVMQKPVEVRGRCAAMVTVDAASAALAGVVVRAGGDGSVIGDIAVTNGLGVIVSGAKAVVLERLWVHDLPTFGVAVGDQLGDAEVTVRESLIERASASGVIVEGAALTMLDSEVRATLPSAAGAGAGINLKVSPDDGSIADVALDGVVVADNLGAGLFAGSASVALRRVAIVDTHPIASGDDGQGLIAAAVVPAARPTVDLDGVVVERSHVAGLLLQEADVVARHLSVRTTRPQQATQANGVAVAAQLDPLAGAAGTQLTLSDSALVGQHAAAMLIVGSHVSAHRVLLTDTVAQASDGFFGDGVAAVGYAADAAVATVAELAGVRVAASARAGVATFGAEVRLTNSQLECNALALNGEELAGETYALADDGGNRCGCEERQDACRVTSSNLAPPNAL
jgi:hypothetical protein